MATNFFERQRQARSDTRRLVLLFGFAVLTITVLATLVVAVVFVGIDDGERMGGDRLADLAAQRWPALLWTAALTIAAIGCASLVRMAQLREGGAAIARGLGGTEIPASSSDFHHKRLRNVVEEVAIASGVPVPQIFVLEHEAGINAFAAGFSTADAAIAVTRGTMEQLDRDELQGVIAHEFSHVLNGDMRLNLRLIGWLAGITLLAVIGRLLMRVRGRNSGGVVLAGVGLFIVGSVGLLCARMIKAGISRKREYLADASAVQFTRQTDGIAGALKKIAAGSHGSRLSAADGEEVSHLLFGDGVGYSRFFATHPPLEQRIQALEPGFKLTDLGEWMRRRAAVASAASAAERQAALPDLEFSRVLGDAGKPIPMPVILAGLPASTTSALTPGEVVSQVGNPGSDDYRTANLLHAALPTGLTEAVQRPELAAPVLAGLLLAAEGGAGRDAQRAALAERWPTDRVEQAEQFARSLTELHPMQRLPLAEIAFAALRRLPADSLRETAALVADLIAADREVSLFEFCLGFLLRQHIDEVLAPAKARTDGRAQLAPNAAAIGLLLSLLAREGHAAPVDAERAFAAGCAELGMGVAPRFALPDDWPDRLGDALSALDQLRPAAKSILIAAMTRAIGHDGRIDVAEAELLRTTCAALHCPLPPLLHEARTRLAAPPTVD